MRQLGLSGHLRRVAAMLDTTYRVRCADGEVLALRVGGTLPIRRPGALMAEALWLESLQGRPEFTVPEILFSLGADPVLIFEDRMDRPRGVMAVRCLRGRQSHQVHSQPRQG